MIRSILYMLVPIFIGLVLIVVIGELWTRLKPHEIAIVTLKPGIVEGNKIEGEVDKKDKYLVIKPKDKPEAIYTWDQIVSITENRYEVSQEIERFFDRIDLISKLAALAAFGVLILGLYQYNEGQKWKSEEFLFGVVKDFMNSDNAANARLMLDSLYLHKKGTKLSLYSDNKSGNHIEAVSNEEIINALDTNLDEEFDKKALAIRESFDAYFNHLDGFNHYIKNGLVSEDSVYTYLNYQINLLGRKDRLKKAYRERILNYATVFEFTGTIGLIERYKKQLEKPPSTKKKK
ncbi:MAG TPA: hypothetical protein VGB17_02305 [Pyrinomonadaceae bacterium]|jgi:hypothetical protein